MAAIAFNAARQKANVRGRLDAALAALRETLDASVSKLMRRAAAQAAYVAPRQTMFSRSTNRTMIAVRTGRQPADEPAMAITEFRPLDPGIVNETIPAFFIGRNKDGFWVARDAGGRIGGIFLFENSALWFARRHSAPSGCATIFPSGRIELDLENNGNPLIQPLTRLMRLARRYRQHAAGAFPGALAGRMVQAVKRRLEV